MILHWRWSSHKMHSVAFGRKEDVSSQAPSICNREAMLCRGSAGLVLEIEPGLHDSSHLSKDA